MVPCEIIRDKKVYDEKGWDLMLDYVMVQHKGHIIIKWREKAWAIKSGGHEQSGSTDEISF